ncbi:ABC transporter permease [Runella sp.]|uniref:ABC transporter permease n=1 Tax=Runella sp. TaxID=1960881 RepID=UPI003D09AC8F
MLRNYLKIAWRNLLKNKTYTFTNVLSLTIGLAACGLIALYIFEEWQVDRFHEKGDRIYRVLTNTISNGKEELAAGTVGRPLAQTILREVPEAEQVVAVRWANLPVKANNQYFFDKELFAGEHFLETFTFPLKEGDSHTALQQPYTLVLTADIARKYFGNESALGKTLLLNDTIPFKVTGVLAESQQLSHIDFQVLISLPTFYAMGGTADAWFTWDEFCYVLLDKNANPEAAEKKISALSMKYNSKEYKNNGFEVTHSLEAVPSIYLHSEASGINKATGSAKQLSMLGAIGIFLLLLACINFINLSTAHQSQRAKEVGVRKAIGAGYSALIGQFIGESLLLALLAGVLSALLMVVALPYLNELTQKAIPIARLVHPLTIAIGSCFLVATGLLAGWYPSLVITRFRPIDTLRGVLTAANKGTWLRQGLVVFQFTISLILIVSTLVVVRQVRFMQAQKLGFTKERVLVVDLRQTPRRQVVENFESIKQQLAALPNIESATGVAALPGRNGWNGQMVWVDGRPQDQAISLEVIPVDHDYVKTLGMNIRHGRDYSKKFTTDAEHGVLLNEAACKALGWKPDEAVGKKLTTPGLDDGQVVGVIADFHQHGLQKKIKPLLTFMAPYAYGYLALRMGSGDVTTSVAEVEKFWKNRFAGYTFNYFFLDEDFNRQYQSEQRTSTIFSVFAVLAILIACLGLFGLAAFTAAKRTKEIGIRKVLGASVTSIVSMLSSEFLKLVFIALVIASPIAWYFMNQWLEDFAYRIEISWWIFGIAGLLAILIAFGTVGFQAIKAALMNPVKSLKTE